MKVSEGHREVTFRIARAKDVLSLVEIMAEFCESEGLSFDWDAAHVFFAEIISHPRQSVILLLNVDGRVAGYLTLIVEEGCGTDEQHAIIDELYIRPPFRSIESSSRAVDFVTQLCRNVGIRAFHQKIGQSYLLTKWV